MGFFSFNCSECHLPITHGNQDGVDDAFRRVVVLRPDGTTFHGQYDGYGRVVGTEGRIDNIEREIDGGWPDDYDEWNYKKQEEFYNNKDNPRVVHEMCHDETMNYETQPECTRHAGQGLAGDLTNELMDRFMNDDLDCDPGSFPLNLEQLEMVQYRLNNAGLDDYTEDIARQVDFVIDRIMPAIDDASDDSVIRDDDWLADQLKANTDFFTDYEVSHQSDSGLST